MFDNIISEKILKGLETGSGVDYNATPKVAKKLHEESRMYAIELLMAGNRPTNQENVQTMQDDITIGIIELREFYNWLLKRDYSPDNLNIILEMIKANISALNEALFKIESRKFVLNQLKQGQYTLIIATISLIISLLAIAFTLIH